MPPMAPMAQFSGRGFGNVGSYSKIGTWTLCAVSDSAARPSPIAIAASRFIKFSVLTSFLSRPHAGNLQTQLEHVRARRDVQAAIVRIAEREVRRADACARLAGWLRQV